MTDARVERTYADAVTAREFLDQADTLFEDARSEGLRAPSKTILLHAATVASCDAILQAVGLRVTAGDRSHVLPLEKALEQLEDDTEELFERLDASRERRNEASYAAASTAQASVDDAYEATAELLALARAFLG